MKKMLLMCLVAVSLVGCTANTETIEDTESMNQTETVDDSSTEDYSIELTDTESMENFQTYMQNNEVEESKKIILPPYTEDDFVLFQVKKGLSDSDRAVIHLQKGVTEEDKTLIQSYTDMINSYAEEGKRVKTLDLKKDDANYHKVYSSLTFNSSKFNPTPSFFNTSFTIVSDIFCAKDALLSDSISSNSFVTSSFIRVFTCSFKRTILSSLKSSSKYTDSSGTWRTIFTVFLVCNSSLIWSVTTCPFRISKTRFS